MLVDSTGSNSDLRVRGVRGVTHGNPLFVIDGKVTNSIGQINIGDVKSINVLKDKTALAYYGPGAENGVILISTRYGAQGKTETNVPINEADVLLQDDSKTFGEVLRKLQREKKIGEVISVIVDGKTANPDNILVSEIAGTRFFHASRGSSNVSAEVVTKAAEEARTGKKVTQSVAEILMSDDIKLVTSKSEIMEVVKPSDNAQQNSDNTPFMRVETMPTFQGGDLTTFRTWVQSQLIYPLTAVEKKISGLVILDFIIEKDGSVSDVTTLRSPDDSLSKEAMRVVSSSPKWEPGMQRGQAVRVKLSIPINFALQ